MQSIIRALNWEYWRRGWFAFLLSLTYMIGIPLLVAGVIRATVGTIDMGDDFDWLPFHFIFLLVSFLGSGAAVLAAQNGNSLDDVVPVRQYVLPVPSWLIVGCRSAQGAVTVSALFTLTALSYRYLFGSNWPVLGPALLLATAMICAEALLWSARDFRFWKFPLYVAVVAAMVFWISGRYTLAGDKRPATYWTEVTLLELVTMGACAAIAFLLAVRGLNRSRRGDALGDAVFHLWQERLENLFPRILRWFDRLQNLVPTREASLRSPHSALMWSAWRRHACMLPVIVGMVGVGIWLGGLVGMAFGEAEPIDVLTAIVGGGVLFTIVFSFGVGCALPENFKHNQTLPASDSALAQALLKTGAVSVLAAWLVLGLFVLAATGFVVALDGSQVIVNAVLGARLMRHVPEAAALTQSLRFGAAAVAVWILVSWTAMGLAVSFSVVPRQWMAWLPMSVLFLAFLFEVTVAKTHLLDPNVTAVIEQTAVALVGLFCLAGTTWAYASARRRGFITTTNVCRGAYTWAGLCAIGWLTWQLQLLSTTAVTDPPATAALLAAACFAAGLLALPLAPRALTPLAVARRRHG